MAEELGRQPRRRHQQQQVVLGDAELDVLAAAALLPVVERVDAGELQRARGGADVVGLRLPGGEDAALVDEAGERRRRRHVGSHRQDPRCKLALAAREVEKDGAKRGLRAHRLGRRAADGGGEVGREGDHLRRVAARRHRVDRRGVDERLGALRVGQPRKRLPLGRRVEAVRGAQRVKLRRREVEAVVVAVALQRQAVPLDREREEARARVGARCVLERLEERLVAVAAEVGHQALQRGVVVRIDERSEVGLGAGGVRRAVVEEGGAPRGAAGEGERRILGVIAIVDPPAEGVAAGALEGGAHLLAELEREHLPAVEAEHAVDDARRLVLHDLVEGLAVVVDDEPVRSHVELPRLEKSLEHVALVELGVADDRDVAPWALGGHGSAGPRLWRQPLASEVGLREARERGERGAEADRARRDVHLWVVLGARRVRLHAAERAELLEVLARLPPHQVHERVVRRSRVRLDGDAVLRLEHLDVERRQDRRDRRRRRLVPADLDGVALRPHVVRVVDHEAREPAHAALDVLEQLQLAGWERGRGGRGRLLR